MCIYIFDLELQIELLIFETKNYPKEEKNCT